MMFFDGVCYFVVEDVCFGECYGVCVFYGVGVEFWYEELVVFGEWVWYVEF